jgi:outer membrane protein assembly factor BamB
MKKTAISLILLLLLASCQTKRIDTEKISSWKSPFGNYYASSFAMETPKPPLQKLWERRLGAYSKTSPVTAGGAVVCADQAGMLYCIDGDTSKDIWTKELAQTENMQPVIGNNSVIVCDGKPSIMSLDINSGSTVWSYDLPDKAVGWPVFGDGRVWICAGKTLLCFEESKGSLIYKQDFTETFTKTPSMQKYMYLVAGKKLIAAVPETGQKAWDLELGKEIVAPICCSRNEIFAVDGRLHKIDDSTGKILQTYTNDLFLDKNTRNWVQNSKLETPFTSGVALYVNIIVIGSKSGEVLGFRTNDISHYVLYHRVNFPVTSTPLLTPDYIWFTSPEFKDSGRFFCIANALNAQWVWHDWLDESVSSHPAATENNFYILTEKGLLIGYSAGGKPVDPAEDARKRFENKENPGSKDK